MSEERLELVTDFAALRAGMIVVVKPCRHCGGSHRHMLTKLAESTYYGRIGQPAVTAKAWDVVPARSCRPDREPVVPPEAVELRIVYRVVDGLNPEADRRAEVIFSTAAQLRKEKVRP